MIVAAVHSTAKPSPPLQMLHFLFLSFFALLKSGDHYLQELPLAVSVSVLRRRSVRQWLDTQHCERDELCRHNTTTISIQFLLPFGLGSASFHGTLWSAKKNLSACEIRRLQAAKLFQLGGDG